MAEAIKMKQVNDYLWEIPKSGKMQTRGVIYATENLIVDIRKDNAPQQVANVACLPGIAGSSMALPDIHWGYGFPIGGVAAFDLEAGVISPGGVGYDINCGVRLMRSKLNKEEITDKLDDLAGALFSSVPSGVGTGGKLKLKQKDLKEVLVKGAGWAVSQGHGEESDLEYIEENGCMPGANPDRISKKALQRGSDQLGTLGSGNHFLEIGYVDEVYDEKAAEVFGLRKGQVTIIIHTGSRGFGHQVCEDTIRLFQKAMQKYRFDLPDKQLCCAPIQSEEGRAYMEAMACAINFGFANRQVISDWVRKAVESSLGLPPSRLGLGVVYEVAHNIAKIEEHEIEGEKKKVCVHRKGATRAFPPGHPEIPAAYRPTGQPVLIPGDMGRYSYVLCGTEKAMAETFGSTCHGAGRLMSRSQAKKKVDTSRVTDEMKKQGIRLMAKGRRTVAEEVPEAYKDVADVVDCVEKAGISKKVVRLRPLAVIKG